MSLPLLRRPWHPGNVATVAPTGVENKGAQRQTDGTLAEEALPHREREPRQRGESMKAVAKEVMLLGQFAVAVAWGEQRSFGSAIKAEARGKQSWLQ